MERRQFIQLMAGGALAAGLNPRAGRSAGSAGDARVAPTDPRRPRRFGDGRDWFFEKRFGMFVHWGLYAIPPGTSSTSGGRACLAPST